MQVLAFEFESEEEMRAVAKKLWVTMGVTGELSMRPVSNGRWRMDLILERELRESTLDKFAQYRVETGD